MRARAQFGFGTRLWSRYYAYVRVYLRLCSCPDVCLQCLSVLVFVLLFLLPWHSSPVALILVNFPMVVAAVGMCMQSGLRSVRLRACAPRAVVAAVGMHTVWLGHVTGMMVCSCPCSCLCSCLHVCLQYLCVCVLTFVQLFLLLWHGSLVALMFLNYLVVIVAAGMRKSCCLLGCAYICARVCAPMARFPCCVHLQALAQSPLWWSARLPPPSRTWHWRRRSWRSWSAQPHPRRSLQQ